MKSPRMSLIERREARYRARRDGIVRPDDVEPDAVMRVLAVPPELAGMRLDRFVQGKLRSTSRTRSQQIILRSAYSPSGERLKKNRRVQAGERVVLWRPPWDELAPQLELDVVYEDDALLAINKPPFVPVHPTARFHRSTITSLLAEQRPDDHLTLLHRLDRETSGVLLLARTRAADRAVKIQFEERRNVVKRYMAITWNAPEWERHVCELPIEPDTVSPYRVKMAIAAPGTGLASATSFEVCDRRGRGDKRYALVRCTLHTGRQHQIRVHLAALGLPVVGDKLYGPDERLFAKGADGLIDATDRERLELDRQALHAAELEIDHPSTGARLRLEAPLYPDMDTFWRRLEP
jgi:23S rRNA pseudouridine1911/1915/1917 synthase